jgi:hypothetical protein
VGELNYNTCVPLDQSLNSGSLDHAYSLAADREVVILVQIDGPIDPADQRHISSAARNLFNTLSNVVLIGV